MQEKELHQLHQEFAELSKSRYDKYFTWLRNVIAMATGLIGVLTALRSGKSETMLEHWLFIITIGLLALGILLGSVVLFAEVSLWSRLQLELSKRISLYVEGKALPKGSVSADIHRAFRVAEVVCYVCLSCALASLVWYVAVSDQ